METYADISRQHSNETFGERLKRLTKMDQERVEKNKENGRIMDIEMEAQREQQRKAYEASRQPQMLHGLVIKANQQMNPNIEDHVRKAKEGNLSSINFLLEKGILERVGTFQLDTSLLASDQVNQVMEAISLNLINSTTAKMLLDGINLAKVLKASEPKPKPNLFQALSANGKANIANIIEKRDQERKAEPLAENAINDNSKLPAWHESKVE